MRPLPEIPGVIDYAHSQFQSDWMDIFLFGRCRFLLGCTSGPNSVVRMFGRPVAAANHIPMCQGPVGPQDIHIPKLLWSESEQRHLNFSEVLLTGRRDWYSDADFEGTGITPHANSPPR